MYHHGFNLSGDVMDDTFQESLLIRALNRKPVERTPVWLMRQAGRYLPEYRKTREIAKSFWGLCQNPELACEVTLQPLRRYHLDAAIVFSDILTIPHAMGFELDFLEKQGPVFHQVFKNADSLKQIKLDGILERLDYVFETVRLVRDNMPAHLPLFGFSGSPWTLACYMIEGKSTREFNAVFDFLYQQPNVLNKLLQMLADVVADYLIAQAHAGAQALMIFDTWGGILPAQAFRDFDLAQLSYIVQKVKGACPKVPVVIFSKGAGFWLPELASTNCDGLGLDWTVDLGRARDLVGHQVSLQGNLHPKVLLQDKKIIRQHVKQLIESYGDAPGHIFNLGHGITPDVPPEAVQILIEAVAEYSSDVKK
jgi:uroporphyrinogen decarboxylase